MRILTFLAGAAAGYVLGTRAGRESYDKMKSSARELWENPRTQEKLNDLGTTIKEKAPGVGAAVGSAASTAAHKVREASTGRHQSDASGDAVSDPARDDTAGGNWSTEGGATPSGPATSHTGP